MISMRTATLLAGIAAVAVMITPASATPVGAGLNAGATGWSDGTSLTVKIKKKKRLRRGIRRKRFRTRRRGFNHFRNGFYYAQPFWNDDDYYEDDYDYDDGDDDEEPDNAGGGDAHEDWCRRKYRSYRPGTDTWTDYDGNTRRCISPFS